MRALLKILRMRGRPNAAVVCAFVLCGMYFLSWYLIAHWSDLPASPILYR